VGELKSQLNHIAEQFQNWKEENERNKAKLNAKDNEISRLTKDNNTLNEQVSKMKETSTNSTNRSEETHYDQSLEEKASNIEKITKLPVKCASRQAREPTRTMTYES
jgi:uncharacterized protein YlxW (UPF0749 family)